MIMDDPDLRPLALDVIASINRFLHKHKKKTSRAAASMSTEEEMRVSCLPATGIQKGKQPDAFTRTQPEAATRDKLLSVMPEEPAA